MRPGLTKRAAYGESSTEAGTEDGLRASEPNHEARRDCPLQQQGIYGSSGVPMESLSVTVRRRRVVTRYYYPSLERETDFFLLTGKGYGCISPTGCPRRSAIPPPDLEKRSIHDEYKKRSAFMAATGKTRPAAFLFLYFSPRPSGIRSSDSPRATTMPACRTRHENARRRWSHS